MIVLLVMCSLGAQRLGGLHEPQGIGSHGRIVAEEVSHPLDFGLQVADVLGVGRGE